MPATTEATRPAAPKQKPKPTATERVVSPLPESKPKPAATTQLPKVAPVAKPKPKPAATTVAASPSGSCSIKGNIASDGEKIYHMPGQQYYDRTKISLSKGERWFCSEAEAVKAGWRAAKV